MTNAVASQPPGGRAERALGALTNWVLAHKRIGDAVSEPGFWIVLTIAGFWGSSQVTDALDEGFSMPSSEAFTVNEEIQARFGSDGGRAPLVAVAELPSTTEAGDPSDEKITS